MAQQLLHGPDVGAPLEHVGGAAVAQHVGPHPAHRARRRRPGPGPPATPPGGSGGRPAGSGTPPRRRPAGPTAPGTSSGRPPGSTTARGPGGPAGRGARPAPCGPCRRLAAARRRGRRRRATARPARRCAARCRRAPRGWPGRGGRPGGRRRRRRAARATSASVEGLRQAGRARAGASTSAPGSASTDALDGQVAVQRAHRHRGPGHRGRRQPGPSQRAHEGGQVGLGHRRRRSRPGFGEPRGVAPQVAPVGREVLGARPRSTASQVRNSSTSSGSSVDRRPSAAAQALLAPAAGRCTVLASWTLAVGDHARRRRPAGHRSTVIASSSTPCRSSATACRPAGEVHPARARRRSPGEWWNDDEQLPASAASRPTSSTSSRCAHASGSSPSTSSLPAGSSSSQSSRAARYWRTSTAVAVVVDGDDGHGAGVADDRRARRSCPSGALEGADGEGDDVALVDDPLVELAEAHVARRPAGLGRRPTWARARLVDVEQVRVAALGPGEGGADERPGTAAPARWAGS